MNATAQFAQNRALVLGGSGFIGRHTAASLVRLGAKVTIGSRNPQRIGQKLPPELQQLPRLPIRMENLCEPKHWVKLLPQFDVVVNCVGIMRQRGGASYRKVHALAPAALARACEVLQIRLVHLSALGLDNPVKSRFLHSKREGELLIKNSCARAKIVRSSLVAGKGGYGADWIRRVANWPLQFAPKNATGKIATLHVIDLGEALARLAITDTAAEFGTRAIELGGSMPQSMADHLRSMRSKGGPCLQIRVVPWLARLISHLCDLLKVTPYSFGHYELLKFDNVPRHDDLTAILNREPLPLIFLARADRQHFRDRRIAGDHANARILPLAKKIT